MDFVLFKIMVSTVICFLIALVGLPVTVFRLSLDLRMYVGLFAVCAYLGGEALSIFAYDVSSTSFILLVVAAILVVSVSAYLLAMLFYISMGKLQQSFLFYAWFMGLLALFTGLHFYIFSISFLILGGICFTAVVLLKKYHLLSVVRTLEVKSDNYEDIERVKLLLKKFNATVFFQKVARYDGYTFSCKYRIPVLAQHIFSRYLFKSDKFSDITLNESL
tara:strand:+ start:297 stop:953 length:657 start_codon:yes stop_codon:yes gene_type:complete